MSSSTSRVTSGSAALGTHASLCLLWHCRIHECGGPRSTLKKAFAENLIPTPEEADRWLRMLEDRNLTSHAYDEALTSRIYQHIVQDYAPLLGGMADRIQTLQWD
jgi:nucleotidyltransferase substrate binding protein (TIGR01987 family)